MATHSSTTSLAASPSPSTGSESPSRASGSRDSVSASASSKGIFPRADKTFNPSPYQPPQRTISLYRPTSVAPPAPAVSFDAPQSTAPPFDGKFIHPPFNNLPESVVLTDEGMNYSVMHAHPTWFLDIADYITLDASPDGAIRYPRDLEPPRPRRQKDLLLRCTFCPRTYAGVNAKSMWTRHVREKHRVVLSKAWSDTATSSRRQSTGKATIATPLLPIDTATAPKRPSTSTSGKSPLTTVPLTAKSVSAPVPKAKPGPKAGKSASPAKAKKVTASTGRKIVIPAQRPKPVPPPVVRAKSYSPPPPEGMLPPRMRPFPRKSFRASLGPLELKALLSGEPTTPGQPPAETNGQVKPLVSEPQTGAANASAAPATDSIASTPPEDGVPNGVATSTSPSSDPSAAPSQKNEPVLDPPPKGSDDGDSIETDKEVADLLLMDVDISLFDEVDEDVDMELEDEEEGLHPPISVGGLVEPMFGVEDISSDLFSLSSRPLVAMSPVFSPALSPAAAQSNEVSREQSVEDARPVTPENVETLAEEETPPLGRFKVSSLAYLMDKNLSVSPPHSPAPTSIRSFTPSPASGDMEDELPTATLFAAMQDVFVLKMQKLNPETKAKFLGHLQEQFGIQVTEETDGPAARDDSALWASLPESIVKQIMVEHARVGGGAGEDEAGTPMAVDTLGAEFAELRDEFKQGSAAQLKDDLECQLQEMVSQFADELVAPLQDALTLQLKNEIIVQVADQMTEALVVQGEEAQIEFEWRRRFLERQLWAPEDTAETQDEVIQHPLHHLFPSKGTSTDMDVRMPTSLLC